MNRIPKEDKCVLYLATLNPYARNSVDSAEGSRKIPVTLPRLNCLDSEKYLPYPEEDLMEIKLESTPQLPKVELSSKEKRAYELYKSGATMDGIAREFGTSRNSVRSMVFRARVKMGERS